MIFLLMGILPGRFPTYSRDWQRRKYCQMICYPGFNRKKTGKKIQACDQGIRLEACALPEDQTSVPIRVLEFTCKAVE